MKNLETTILNRTEIEDKQWNGFIDASPQATIYAYTWYLDAICEKWIAIVTLNKAKEWIAVMPIPIFTKLKMQRCYMPIFCQHLAIFFKPFSIKYEKELGLKKKILFQIIKNIPSKIKILKYNTSINNKYLLPFYWQGYQLKIRYSYWLKVEVDKQKNYKQFGHRTRTSINKAIKNGLTCRNNQSIETIVKIGKKEIDVAFNEKVLYKLWEVLKPKNLIENVEAVDTAGKVHGGIIYLKYRDRYIYLFGTVDKTVNHFGSMSLIIWHIIKNAESGIVYQDFQGSMLEPIEKFYRGFATYPVPYTQIYTNNLSLPLKMAHWFYLKVKSK